MNWEDIKKLWARRLKGGGYTIINDIDQKLLGAIPQLVAELEAAQTQMEILFNLDRSHTAERDLIQAELDAVQTQSRCDLIGGEPGHQKLLCDRLQAELDAARKETATQAAMIEEMAMAIMSATRLSERPGVGSLIKYYREQAEKARAE